MEPLLSIVTITYNSEKYLQDTIDSVASQTYPFIEYIIIDGQSTDDTLSIIKRNEEKINFWSSEKDNGIADAMNKGLEKVTGDFVLFLHSDDYLVCNNCIEDALNYLDDLHDIFAFSILFKTKDQVKHKKTPSWDARFNLKTKLLHQGVLCRKDLFERIGVFSTRYKVAMDYDFFLRAYRKRCNVKLIDDFLLSVMRDTGVSSRGDWDSLKRRFAEEKIAHYKNSTGLFMNLAYGVYWLAYPAYRKLKLVRST